MGMSSLHVVFLTYFAAVGLSQCHFKDKDVSKITVCNMRQETSKSHRRGEGKRID
jgi:hypothetical protein